jgi:hypothetical protein
MEIEYESQQDYFMRYQSEWQQYEAPAYNAKWVEFDEETDLRWACKPMSLIPLAGFELFDEQLLTDTKDSSPKSGVNEPEQAKMHSKDCLKASRRLSKLMLYQIGANGSFLSGFLGASAQVINSVLAVLALGEINSKSLIRDQATVLCAVWEKFKNCLSYHKNKKICIVKSEYWDNVFSFKVFSENAKQTIKSLKSSQLKRVMSQNELVFNSFCEVLFSINKLMTLTFILRDNSINGGQFLRQIETINKLLVLVVDARLFEFYNHRSGKFAQECCGKCKICCSKDIPYNFAALLQEAREKVNTVVRAIPVICSTDLESIQEQELLCLLPSVTSR